MVRMFFRHDVSDYDSWRKVYDSIDADRPSAGVTGHAVYRGTDDGNDVTGWHDFGTAEQAQAFAASPLLHDAMKNAGVVGAPQIWFTTPA
jgi:hypothetical protein